MDKTEFLDQLRMSLSGRIEADKVTDNLRFYEDYINTQIRLGKSEDEVMMTLGEPRLIARTITDMQKEETEEREESYRSYGDSRSEQSGGQGISLLGRIFTIWFRLPAGVRLILGIFAVMSVVGAVFSLLAYLIPILLPLFIVVFLIKAFRDWLN